MRRGLLVLLLLACSPSPPPAPSLELIKAPSPGGDSSRFVAGPRLSESLPDSSFVITDPDASPAALPRLFTHDGHFLRSLGREGSGPGEFREAGTIVVSGDSLIVFDNRARRGTVLLGSNTVRTFLLSESVLGVIRLPDQTFVASHAAYEAGPALRHLSAEGVRLSAFGDSATIPDHDSPEHFLAVGPDSTFWSAPSDRSCRLTQWAKPGVIRQELSLCWAWFAPYDQYEFPTPDRAPLPRLTGIWIDPEGHIWVAGRVADPEWRSALGPPVKREGQLTYPVIAPGRLTDGILEVYTPDGQFLAWLQHDAAFRQLLPGPLLVTLARDEDGWLTPDRWQVKLRQPNNRMKRPGRGP